LGRSAIRRRLRFFHLLPFDFRASICDASRELGHQGDGHGLRKAAALCGVPASPRRRTALDFKAVSMQFSKAGFRKLVECEESA
jgi:hypothetical protein